jgi:hypothetical protein
MNGSKKAVATLMIVLRPALACSVKRFAVNKVGDALSRGGSTYECDDHLELVKDALPVVFRNWIGG